VDPFNEDSDGRKGLRYGQLFAVFPLDMAADPYLVNIQLESSILSLNSTAVQLKFDGPTEHYPTMFNGLVEGETLRLLRCGATTSNPVAGLYTPYARVL
jgi:hypothetical protein